MSESVVLTIVCDDRPGIVQTLSRVLEDHDGNWTESSMLSLAGKFAGILKASVPEHRVDDFLNGLVTLESQGLHIVAQRSADRQQSAEVREVNLNLVGQDRPGIVNDITEIFCKHEVNVHELDTECQSASMSGETLFLAKVKMGVPAETSLDALRADLENLANELMVDIQLDH